MFVYQNGKLTEDPLPVPWNQDSRRSLPRWLMEDQQGQVWLGTRGAGIFFRDGQKWQLFSEAPLLSQVQSACAVQDHDSTLWFGMDGAGLFQLRPNTVVSLEPRSDIQPSCFWSVCAASDGSILGGTDGNGIFRWKDGVLTHFRSGQGLANEHVNAIIEDRKGRIWAGTMSGLFILERDRFKAVTGVDTLRLPVFTLKEDQSGRLWVGTRNGLIEMSATATNVFGETEGIPYGPINAVEEDHDGRIWVSIPPFRDRDGGGNPGQYGLFAQSGRTFEHIAAGKWAGEPNIRALHADASGNLWIGTIGTGFFRLKNGKFTEYSWEDGIPHNRIQAMVADGSGNLWFCSELGVFGCPIEQLENHTRSPNARLNWWRIQRRDGLPNKMATGNGQPCAVRGPDGRIWFANANALTGFDPECVTATAPLAPPVVEEILVGGLPQTLGPGERLTIRSESRRIEIHFTSPNTTTPNLPTFWTRLKGLESEWSGAGAGRVASYHLPPGKYEFALAVTGPAGARLETAHPLQIEVVPTLLERKSVRISAGVMLIVAIAFGVRWWEKSRSQRRLRQLEMQRALDQVRQRIARDIHDDLGSGLTEITLLSDNLRMDLQRPGLGEKTVERIATRARALTHEMDEVVWAINPHTDTLESLVTYLNDFAQERLALAGIRCRLNTATELPDVELPSDVRHSLYRAAKEALNNAIRHAAPSEVAITIEPHNGSLVFTIQDDGRGFDPEQHFKRGNGLRNMQHRLEEIGGSCTIQSRLGGGTSVCLTIPRAPHHVASQSTNGHNGEL
jgi:signal transduction histidine kinase/streptogramin lyase